MQTTALTVVTIFPDLSTTAIVSLTAAIVAVVCRL
jgi:hypothetical protein